MGAINKAKPAKLIMGMISGQEVLFAHSQQCLVRKFGRVDLASPTLEFKFTAYYEAEIGKNLKRKFIAFAKLIDPGEIAKIKIYTNKLEKKFCRKDLRRRINLDPGYINDGKLVLATTKDHQHRIYLGGGIYAEVTLRYTQGKFQPWEWTYPDYHSAAYLEFFEKARKGYLDEIRNNKER